jgi:hypothetical protein
MRKPTVAFAVLPKVDIRDLSDIKLLSDVKGTSINDGDFYKFRIPVRGGHCDYSPPHSKKPSYVTGYRFLICLTHSRLFILLHYVPYYNNWLNTII